LIFVECLNCLLITICGRRDRDRMVIGLSTTYVIGAYHH